MISGKTIGIRFTYTDGSTYSHGSWKVPHDSEHAWLDEVGAEVGWTILYEIAKQPTKTVVKVEVLPWPIQEGT